MSYSVTCKGLIETGKGPLGEFKASCGSEFVEMCGIGIVEIIDGQVEIGIAAVIPRPVLQETVMLKRTTDVSGVVRRERSRAKQTKADMYESFPHRRRYTRHDYRRYYLSYQE